MGRFWNASVSILLILAGCSGERFGAGSGPNAEQISEQSVAADKRTGGAEAKRGQGLRELQPRSRVEFTRLPAQKYWIRGRQCCDRGSVAGGPGRSVARPTGDGAAFRALNKRHGFEVRFGRRSTVLSPFYGRDWRLEVRLAAVAKQGTTKPVEGGEIAETRHYELTRRLGVIEEYFRNAEKGLKHGFELSRKVKSFVGDDETFSLRISLEGRGIEIGSATDDAIRFERPGGKTVLEYRGLVGRDASGRPVDLEFGEPKQMRGGSTAMPLQVGLPEKVDYPVDIDPTFQSTKLGKKGFTEGEAIELADLDGDGDKDAVIANKGEPNTVWYNNGDGRFTDSGQALGQAFSKGLALGDIDGDGDPDLYVANRGQPNRVWVNTGDGTFEDSGQKLGLAGSEDVVLADFTGDGQLDAFVANRVIPGRGKANQLWINEGDGTFSKAASTVGKRSSNAVASGDFNEDGALDVIAGNDSGQADKVWYGNKDGTFQPGPDISSGNQKTTDVALGDFDGDGRVDAFMAKKNAPNRIFHGNQTGVFTDSGKRLGSGFSAAVALADFDSDGSIDAFAGNRFGNRIWLNNGDGQLTPTNQTLGGRDTRGVAGSDFEGDGDVDVFAANDGATNTVWLNQGDGTFSKSGQVFGNSPTTGVGLARLDEDDDVDVFFANRGDPNAVWKNDGDGGFDNTGQGLGEFRSVGLAMGDLNEDGRIDAVVANDGQPNRAWLNRGSGVYEGTGQAFGSVVSTDVGLGDVDGDRDLDAFFANKGQADNVWLNDGSGMFESGRLDLGKSASAGIVVADFNGDGSADAAVANDGGKNTVWLGDGQGGFTEKGGGFGQSPTLELVPGDFDGDGDLDLFAVNFDAPNRVWVNDGTGAFSDSEQALGKGKSRAATVFDVERDLDPDVFVVNEGQPNGVWLNDGAGKFSKAGGVLGKAKSLSVDHADVDGDGDADVVVGNDGRNAIWRNDTNSPPRAKLSVSPRAVKTGQSVSLDGSETTDPNDSSDALSFKWRIKARPDAAGEAGVQNKSSARATFKPPAAGTYTFELTVTDPEGLDDTATGSVDVSAPNEPPEFVSPTPMDGVSASPGEPVEFEVAAKDPDGGSVQISATKTPKGATFSADSGFEWTPRKKQVGTHSAQFEATDGEDSTTHTVQIRVKQPDQGCSKGECGQNQVCRDGECVDKKTGGNGNGDDGCNCGVRGSGPASVPTLWFGLLLSLAIGRIYARGRNSS